MITYRGALDVPGELVQFVAGRLAAGRRRGTPRGSRALTCLWQAVPGVRCREPALGAKGEVTGLW